MSDRAISFTFSVLIHLLLVVALCFAIFDKNTAPPPTVTIDVTMIGDVAKNKKTPQQVERHEESIKQSDRGAHYHSQNSNSQAQDAVTKIVPIANPLPEIPQDLRVEAFQSEAIARFYIDSAGNVEKVELVKPCANPRLNNLLLKSLRQWKFSPSNKSSTQDINVKFRVQ